MKNALRIVVFLLSVVALYGSAVPTAMADGNPFPCPPGTKRCVK
jgi:hypothetical protein